MMLKKKVLAAALGAMMVSGAAQAIDVTNGKGDLLIAPSYMIGGSWSSEIKIINTSLTDSVVAKVVVHDAIQSDERMDFLVYLSPGDVFVGNLNCTASDANGVCTAQEMRSTDDSVLVYNSTSFASAAAPAIYPATRISSIGYITVIESSAVITGGAPGTPKATVKAAFDASPAAVATTATPDVLTGFLTISNSVNGQSASLPMMAFSNYNNIVKQVVGADSSLGAPRSQATVADIEDVLWTNSFAVPYTVNSNSFSMMSITYPTKLTYRNAVSGQYPFTTGAASTVCITNSVFDLTEQTIAGPNYNVSPLPTSAPLCTAEHTWLVMGNASANPLIPINTGSFESGWANINFSTTLASVGQTSAASVNLGKVGAPGVVTYINTKGSQIHWHYAPNNN